MWEDAGAWNAYADQGNSYAGYGDYNNWGAGEPSFWSDSPALNMDWGQNWSQPSQGWDTQPQQPSYTPSWQQEYTFEPQYTPGAAWNPSPAQVIGSPNAPVEQVAQRMGNVGPIGNQGALYYRGFPGYENNAQIRDAQHYAESNAMFNNPYSRASGAGSVASLTAPALYNLAKMGAQALPDWLQQYLPSLAQASAPAWSSVWAGMRPVWGNLMPNWMR